MRLCVCANHANECAKHIAAVFAGTWTQAVLAATKVKGQRGLYCHFIHILDIGLSVVQGTEHAVLMLKLMQTIQNCANCTMYSAKWCRRCNKVKWVLF